MRRKGADDFADIVIRRSSYDTIIRSKYILLMMCISLLCAAALSSVLCERYIGKGMLSADSFDVVVPELVSCLCCFLCFTLYLMCRRVRDHHERDGIWRGALISYLSSYGKGVDGLKEIDSRASAGRHGLAALVSLAIWMMSVTVSIALPLAFLVWETDTMPMHIMVQSAYVMVIVQFLCTLGTAIRYPARHDALQVEFADAMDPLLRELGIDVEPLRPMVKSHSLLANIILFVITFGLYSLYMIGSSATNMNRHIYSQWGYEEKLLSEIMRVEGAIGINAIQGEEDPNLAVRILKSLT